jgi:hypothetical protein
MADPVMRGGVLQNDLNITGVTFEQKVEDFTRPSAIPTCLDTGPSGPYTRTTCIRVMREGLMVGRDRQRSHDLAVSRVRPNPQPSVRRLSAIAPWRRP